MKRLLPRDLAALAVRLTKEEAEARIVETVTARRKVVANQILTGAASMGAQALFGLGGSRAFTDLQIQNRASPRSNGLGRLDQ